MVKPVFFWLAAAVMIPDLAHLKQMSARFAPVPVKYDTSTLSTRDRQALPKLIEAARQLNLVYMDQISTKGRGPAWTTIPRSCLACPNESHPGAHFIRRT